MADVCKVLRVYITYDTRHGIEAGFKKSYVRIPSFRKAVCILQYLMYLITL